MYGTYIDYTKYYKLQKTVLSGTSKMATPIIFVLFVLGSNIYKAECKSIEFYSPEFYSPEFYSGD